MCWFVYMIRTDSGALYTGITTDLLRRFAEHQTGKGAKALRGKGELKLVYQVEAPNHRVAAQLEYRIKQLSKSCKEFLVQNQLSLADLLIYHHIDENG